MPILESIRDARWFRQANLVLQAVLFLTLVAGLNYLASDHPSRFDLTRYWRNTLSPETVAYLRDLGRSVQIVVTFGDDSVSPELRGLLREYVYATEGNPDGGVAVQYLDVYIFRHDAEHLGVDEANRIWVRCGDKTRVLTLDDLYRVQNGERQAFQGEQAITSAILDVSNPAPKKIYFLAGHGELRPDDADATRGLSLAREQLRLRNFDVGALELGPDRPIPDDSSLLVAVAPQSPYTPFEQEQLRQYLRARAGKLILFLAPGYAHGLDSLLQDWGVTVDDDFIRDSGAQNVTEDGDLIIQKFQPHPITQALINYKIALRVGLARSVRPDSARAAANGLDIVTLAATSPTAWGQVNYRLREAPAGPSNVDIRPQPAMIPPNRLGLAVAVEPVTVRDNLPFSVPRGRLVVFGTGDLIDNARFANAGVLNILLGAVNWTVNRDTQLNIPARPLERFQLSLSAAELRNLRDSLLFVLPGVAALLGLMVYWTRRS
jgi:hypothetical protein